MPSFSYTALNLYHEGFLMAVRRLQVKDEEGKVCTVKCWVIEAVGGFNVGFEVFSKGERFQAFSDANCEQIAWYDVKSQILDRGYKVVEELHEY